MAYKNAEFYYMSGTGNTHRAAKWMNDVADSKGVNSNITPIERAQPEKDVADDENQLVGLLMPAHGFTAPWAMIRFALRMPRRKKTHAFVAATRAGVKCGSIYIPGMEGTAAYLIALILVLKGFKIRGIIGLDMPSNWIALHPGFSKENAECIIERAKPRTDAFIEKILSGKKSIGGYICFALGLLLIKVSFMYLIMARFILSKLFIASNQCDGCGICAKNCPMKAILMWGKKHSRPYWTFTCESCMRCMAYCPKEAIQAGHSWAAVIWYMLNIPVGIYLLNHFSAIFPWVKTLDNGWGRWIIQYVYCISSIYISYLGLNYITRIPLINALFTYTTLTRVYRRYHEPETSLKDL